MINSIINKLAGAEKLSVAQLQQAIKDGTIPAYVGIPMLQDKMKQAQQAQATRRNRRRGQEGEPGT